MNSLVLFEDEGFVDLLPLVFWRSMFELQVGRKTLLERIVQCLRSPISGVWTRDWIAPVAGQRCGAPANYPLKAPTVLVNGRWLFNESIQFPKPPCVGVVEGGETAYIVCDQALAAGLAPRDLLHAERRDLSLRNVPRQKAPGRLLKHAWEVIRDLHDTLVDDWSDGDAGIHSRIDNRVLAGPQKQVHIGERAQVHPTSIVDASAGPIFIGDDVVVGPYAILEGPLYLGPGSRVHPYCRLHGGNAIGPVCKIGGELHGCVVHAYTNKQHEGFLGHAYVGSWVNIGAGAVNSDLKNTYGTIRVPINGADVETGMQFFGCLIADHAKLGIHATVPTGAVISFAASISAVRMLPKYVPSFSWVTDDRLSLGDPLKALDVATAVMGRRNVDMTDEEVELFLDLGQRVRQFEGRGGSA
jgi:UDP-N-acetylglucosamine diphosphorylase/glucosamine-1-phosphate N-acetyltransferase